MSTATGNVGVAQRRTLRALLPVVALFGTLAVVIMACGGSSGNTGTSVGTNGGSSTSATGSGSSKHFKVGDQVKVGDTFVVTVNSIKRSTGDEFDTPKSGNVFVVIDVTFKNVGTDEQDLSTDLQCTLKDATGQKYEQTIISGATAPDGKLVAGDTVKGQIVYEVSASQHDFTFSFESDIFGSGQTVWDLHV